MQKKEKKYNLAGKINITYENLVKILRSSKDSYNLWKAVY